jgi:parallel beta-helix repeat protein
LQAKIDAAPSGGTVTASPCIYREEIRITKPLTLKGQDGTEIRGSDVWSAWSGTGPYVSTKTVPSFTIHGSCAPGHPECLWPEQVFIDGKHIEQVASSATPRAGQFKVDSNRRIVLGDNPAGKVVEVTVRPEWLEIHADNVIIDNVDGRHAGTDSQNAALESRANDRVTVKNGEYQWGHAQGLVMSNGVNLTMENNYVHHNGQAAAGASEAQITVRSNEFSYNNNQNFLRSWDAAGMKAALINPGSVWERNLVHHNRATGLWCDLGCNGVTYRYNTLHHNARGIFYEISTNGIFHDNIIYENGWATSGSVEGEEDGSWAAALGVGNSHDVEIFNNTVAWNKSNIAVVRIDRSDNRGEVVSNVYVHDNTIFSKDYTCSSCSSYSGSRTHALAWNDGVSLDMYDPARNNRGFSNDYYFPASEDGVTPRFMWNRKGVTSLTTFNATGGEESGRYLSKTEKDAIVVNKGIPASPESH